MICYKTVRATRNVHVCILYILYQQVVEREIRGDIWLACYNLPLSLKHVYIPLYGYTHTHTHINSFLCFEKHEEKTPYFIIIKMKLV